MKRILLGITLFISFGMVLADTSSLVQWSNEYIRIFVAQTEQEMGRFAVDTTGGDPSRSDDDKKPLIYGHPTPWTSFTTLRIDGKDWVFGGSTNRRAGQGGAIGCVISPPHRIGEEIVTTFDYQGLHVEQRIGPGINPYSGREDSARIRYILRNTTSIAKSVGVRTVFDTMLGANDGAPFRVGGQTIAQQTHLSKTELPDIWQAFDSLSSPSVIAQGVLKGYGVTPPDRVVFADWGTAADCLWEIPREDGRNFIRAGEDEPDTSLVLFWNPASLSPGESREITVLYGLGGVTMVPGASFLGMAAPAEIVYHPTEPKVYQVMAYIENHTDRIAQNVRVSLALPPGIAAADTKENTVLIPRMEPREIRQILWAVKADGTSYGAAEISLNVTGDDLNPNKLTRPTRIVGPPSLKAEFAPWNPSTIWQGEPLRLSVTISNQGGATARNAWVELGLPNTLRLAAGDHIRRHLVDLLPGEQCQVHWWVVPSGAGKAEVHVIAGYQDSTQRLATNQLNLPRLTGEIRWVTARPPRVGQGFCLELIGERLPTATGFTMDFHYDPKVFRMLRVAEGRFSMGDPEATWHPGVHDPALGLIQKISVKRQTPVDDNKYSLIRIFLVPLNSGTTMVSVDPLVFHNPRSGDLPPGQIQTKIQIEEATP